MSEVRVQSRVRVGAESAVVPAPVVPVRRREAADPAAVAEDREALLQAAHEEAAAIHAEAFRQGHAQGTHQAEVDAIAMARHFAALGRSLEAERDRVLRSAEPQVVALALDVARVLVAQELALRPEAVVSMVAVALEELVQREPLRIRLHPEDLDLVAGHGVGSGRGMPELVPDAELERGDCVVETASGSIDARVGTRLGEMRRVMLEAASHDA